MDKKYTKEYLKELQSLEIKEVCDKFNELASERTHIYY